MVELKADGEDQGEDKLDECLGVVKELSVGGFIVEIDVEGAVLAWWFGSVRCLISIGVAVDANETS